MLALHNHTISMYVSLLCLYCCASKFEVFDAIQYEFVISPLCAVQIHNDGDGDSICVNRMERCRVVHG